MKKMKSDIRANRRPSSSRSLSAEKAGFYISPKSVTLRGISKVRVLSIIANIYNNYRETLLDLKYRRIENLFSSKRDVSYVAKLDKKTIQNINKKITKYIIKYIITCNMHRKNLKKQRERSFS